MFRFTDLAGFTYINFMLRLNIGYWFSGLFYDCNNQTFLCSSTENTEFTVNVTEIHVLH